MKIQSVLDLLHLRSIMEDWINMAEDNMSISLLVYCEKYNNII